MEKREGEESLSTIASDGEGLTGMFHERYVNPYTDFGFKKLFGTERIFGRLFDQAEIARYSLEERREYETSVKEYRDYITLSTLPMIRAGKKDMRKAWRKAGSKAWQRE